MADSINLIDDKLNELKFFEGKNKTDFELPSNDEFVTLEEALEIIDDDELLSFMNDLNDVNIQKITAKKDKKLISMEELEKIENDELLRYMDGLNQSHSIFF